jgi:ABC-type molybdate transport system substrate-binding protein
MRGIVSRTCFAAFAVTVSAGIAAADEVKLISVGGVKLALDPIIADFSKQTGHKVTYTVGSPALVSGKLAAGEAFDVVVQSAPAMDELAKASGLSPRPASRSAVVASAWRSIRPQRLPTCPLLTRSRRR